MKVQVTSINRMHYDIMIDFLDPEIANISDKGIADKALEEANRIVSIYTIKRYIDIIKTQLENDEFILIGRLVTDFIVEGNLDNPIKSITINITCDNHHNPAIIKRYMNVLSIIYEYDLNNAKLVLNKNID